VLGIICNKEACNCKRIEYNT